MCITVSQTRLLCQRHTFCMHVKYNRVQKKKKVKCCSITLGKPLLLVLIACAPPAVLLGCSLGGLRGICMMSVCVCVRVHGRAKCC